MQFTTANDLIDFEDRIAKLWRQGKLPYLLHLSGVNERQLIRIFKEKVRDGDWILSTHRSHYHYLLAGGLKEELETMIRNGDSMFIFDERLHFMSTAILGGMCGIAAGLALAIQEGGDLRHVWCFIGDGAEDNGHLYEAARFVQSKELPCTFIIEDNDRSVTVSKKQRGASYIMNWPGCVQRYKYRPTYPHAGDGSKKQIGFKV